MKVLIYFNVDLRKHLLHALVKLINYVLSQMPSVFMAMYIYTYAIYRKKLAAKGVTKNI